MNVPKWVAATTALCEGQRGQAMCLMRVGLGSFVGGGRSFDITRRAYHLFGATHNAVTNG